jgi:hypothetical protein
MNEYRKINAVFKAQKFSPADWEGHDRGPYCEGYVVVNKSFEYGEVGRWRAVDSYGENTVLMPGDWIVLNDNGSIADIVPDETFQTEYMRVDDSLLNRVIEWARGLI